MDEEHDLCRCGRKKWKGSKSCIFCHRKNKYGKVGIIIRMQNKYADREKRGLCGRCGDKKESCVCSETRLIQYHFQRIKEIRGQIELKKLA